LKKLVVLMALALLSFASSIKIEQEICDKILCSIFKNKMNIKVWIDDIDIRSILENNGKIIFTKNPKDADILIVKHQDNILVNKPIFVKKYYLLKIYKNRAIGGFYWQKGRPNIVFLKSTLKRYHIKLPKDLNRYIESDK